MSSAFNNKYNIYHYHFYKNGLKVRICGECVILSQGGQVLGLDIFDQQYTKFSPSTQKISLFYAQKYAANQKLEYSSYKQIYFNKNTCQEIVFVGNENTPGFRGFLVLPNHKKVWIKKGESIQSVLNQLE